MEDSCQIGISVYKQPFAWIKASVESALNQSKTSSIICTVRLDGPNACDLEAQSWLFWHKEINKKLRLIIGSKRIGSYASYREIFKTSNTKFLCQLDADDWLETSIIQKCLENIKANPDASFVYTNYREFNVEGKFLRQGSRTASKFSLEEQLIKFGTFHLRFIRRSIYDRVGGYNPYLKYTGDYDLSLKLAEYSLPHHINIDGYAYRIHSNNTSRRHEEELFKEALKVSNDALVRQKKVHRLEIIPSKYRGKFRGSLLHKKGPLVVAGMHRSGTSLLANMLHKLGVDLGSKLLPSDSRNPHGYFEDIEAIMLNSLGLKTQGLDQNWGFKVIDNPHLETKVEANWLNAAKKYLASRHRTDKIWGWKDPRNSLMLKHWFKVEPGFRVIFVFREPWDVANSLASSHPIFRGNLNLILETWLKFNQHLLDLFYANPERFFIVYAQDLIERPESLIREMICHFQLPDLYENEKKLDLRAIVDPSCWHDDFNESQLISEPLFQEVMEVFQTLINASR